MAKLARSGKAPSQRQLKAGEVIRHALAEALRMGDSHDPALMDVSITVSEVRVSPDLRHAVAFVMPLMGERKEAVLAALKRTRGLYRSVLAKATSLKFAPDIDFELDDAFDRSLQVDALLRSDKVRRDLEGEQES
jgi:ribosome-binding factor A